MKKSTIDYTPWVFVRHSVLMKDGSWEHEGPGNYRHFHGDDWKGKIWSESHPYFYFDQSKGDQSCTATIEVHEREWVHEETADRKISKDIEVSFSKELGREAGSWKGGIVGCGYEMKDGETPLDTLRRMEKERSFS